MDLSKEDMLNLLEEMEVIPLLTIDEESSHEDNPRKHSRHHPPEGQEAQIARVSYYGPSPRNHQGLPQLLRKLRNGLRREGYHSYWQAEEGRLGRNCREGYGRKLEAEVLRDCLGGVVQSKTKEIILKVI
jgi:hypothetical protein